MTPLVQIRDLWMSFPGEKIRDRIFMRIGESGESARLRV